MESFRDWAEFYKVLGDATRLRLVALLGQGPHCVCELVELLGVSQPTISHHLSRLRHAGLIQEQRHGQWTFYFIVTERVSFWSDLVGALPTVAIDSPALSANNGIACKMGHAPVQQSVVPNIAPEECGASTSTIKRDSGEDEGTEKTWWTIK
jgi:ArsR family transcriptional regulator